MNKNEAEDELRPARIGVGKATNLPSLRTVQAVLPHTALQSAFSVSGQIDDLNLLQGASVIATESDYSTLLPHYLQLPF